MVRLNVQGAGLFLRPAADALATASDVPLDLPEAIAFLTGMLCYVLYTTHFNGNGKYPLECDAALPLPYPARSVPYLRALLQQRTDPASSQALLDGQPNAPRTPAAGQTGRGLASLELRSAYGGSDAVGASTFGLYDRSSDYGASSSSLEVAARQPDDVSDLSTAQLQQSEPLLRDALCYATLAARLVAGDVDSLVAEAMPVRVLASVRFPVAGCYTCR